MVLFLNKKKLQEQKPLVNNTYQGKRDTNKKSLWDIFSKKPKMVFPVGEGLNEEAAQKAHEIVRQPAIPEAKIDYPSAQKNVRDFLNNFTPREEAVPVRRAFEKEPVMTKAPPIVTSLGQLGFSILEAIPRAVATFYGEVSAPERKTGEVDIGINAKRLGYENEKYRTAAKEFKDKVEAGENPWIAGLNVVSNKTLDVAFGAQLLSSISRFITRKLTSGAIDRKLAKETVDAFKKNQKQLFESTKNLPLLEREKALADLTNARDVAERILIEKGLPTTLDKARIGTSKYTDVLGRETSIRRGFWSRFAQPDMNIKPTELAPSPIAGLLPGERPKPGQAPNIGLSLQEVEYVGKDTLTGKPINMAEEIAKKPKYQKTGDANFDAYSMEYYKRYEKEIKPQLLKHARATFDEPGKVKVIDVDMSGSYKRGTPNPESDLDVKVYYEGTKPVDEFIDQMETLSDNIYGIHDVHFQKVEPKSQLTDIWNKAQANIKPATETLKPAVIQGETFTLGTSKTTQPTLKERKLELKATQKEIKNAQIAREKAAKLELKEQKIRENAINNIQRFKGNLNNIEAELKAKNLSDEDIDNIVLENGMKLRDVAKVKRNNDGSLSTVITKKEIDDLLANYTDEVSREKWVKKSMLVNAVEVPINLAKSIELPYSYFERKGLSSIYDEVIESQRTAELMRTRFIKKFEDAGLYKKGSWFTANRFAISDNEAKGISKYYLGRQGRGKEIPITDLSEKSQEFVRIFDEIIDETTENFYKVAQRMGKKPGVVENYAPIMTRDDIELIDQGGTADWLFRKHPAFFSLKERVKKAPEEIYETDYRKVATRWVDGISQFISMGDTTNHLKYLVNSDEFSNIVKGSDKDVISKWLKDITTPKIPNTTIKKALTPLSKLLRKGVAMGALGLNYATVLKQALTQIPIAIIEKSLPKTRSKYAKAFGINASDLPSISKRTGDIAISDMQGKIGRIFTGGISEFDKKNAQFAINGLLDKEYNKFLKSGAEITPQIQKLIEKNAQDKIDMWFGGFFKGQRPEAFREEAGNFILMFTYPLTSQLNGFFRHIFKAKGFGTKSKAIAEVLAAVVGIAYMEKVIENLSLEWSDEKEMTKDILISLTGNIPLVGDIAYSIATGQSLNISPVISNIDNIVRSISDKNTEKIAWNVFETIGLPKQIRRVKEGMEILEDGGITDNNGKMLAPVQDAMEYIRAFLRGKYGPIASQDYIRNIGKSKDERRWFVPEVEFLQNGDYNRKAELYKSFDRETQRELYNFLSENQQKKLDKELDNKTDTTNKKSLSDIFK